MSKPKCEHCNKYLEPDGQCLNPDCPVKYQFAKQHERHKKDVALFRWAREEMIL